MAEIISIAYTPDDIEQRPKDRYARVAVQKAMLVQGLGILGDTKGVKGRRQLNVMQAETVAQLQGEGFNTKSGELGEQLVIAGLDAEMLGSGVRLRLGESAVIEITYPRTPCSRFARIQGRPRDSVRGRIGFLAQVLCDGEIRIGSLVTIVKAT